MMKLIIGLGNPGSQYEKTRHNAGFMALDRIAEKFHAGPFKESLKHNASLTDVEINGQKILLAKPSTFMNLSGKAAISLKNFYKIANADIFVIYDDLDLEIGKIRIRKKGSPGTHNGARSLVEALGDDFARLRIGIHSPKTEKIDLSSFVLSSFATDEMPNLTEVLQKTPSIIFEWIENGIESVMTKYN